MFPVVMVVFVDRIIFRLIHRLCGLCPPFSPEGKWKSEVKWSSRGLAALRSILETSGNSRNYTRPFCPPLSSNVHPLGLVFNPHIYSQLTFILWASCSLHTHETVSVSVLTGPVEMSETGGVFSYDLSVAVTFLVEGPCVWSFSLNRFVFTMT